MDRSSVVVGYAELIDLPKWAILGVPGKIDTGARTSALHVSNIHDVGSGRVGFDVRLHRKRADKVVRVEAKVLRRTRVRPSSGESQARIVVGTTLRIGDLEREVEFSLVDRKNMIFRMLIGRSALGHGVLVDPSRRYVATEKRERVRRARAK